MDDKKKDPFKTDKPLYDYSIEQDTEYDYILNINIDLNDYYIDDLELYKISGRQ